jgi:hypothetical protein
MEKSVRPDSDGTPDLFNLSRKVSMARTIDQLAADLLPVLASENGRAFLYAADSRLLVPRFFGHGFQAELAGDLESFCASSWEALSGNTGNRLRNPKRQNFRVRGRQLRKQPQGQNSCKGCKRPLGSWTPCVKYRKAEL